jgi:hypothetical protein
MEVDESSMLPALKELEVNRSDQHNAGKLSRIFTESEKTFEDIVDREGVPTDLLNENIKAENKILNAEENQHQQSLEQEDATEQLSAKLEGALVNWRKRYQQNGLLSLLPVIYYVSKYYYTKSPSNRKLALFGRSMIH